MTLHGKAWWPGEAEVRMREEEAARREHGPDDERWASPAFQLAPPRDVWPCRKCGEPALPHHPDCFWAEHQQGAVQGMRYAWTPAEAKLGAIIEQQEDEAEILRNEAVALRMIVTAQHRALRAALVVSLLLAGWAGYAFAELVL